MDWSLTRRIVPELVDVLRSRVRIMQRIYLAQPIGRRALAIDLGLTERVLRAEVDFLKQQGLIVASPAGMSLSEEGEDLLESLDEVVASLEGRTELSKALARVLDIERVIVVSGDSDRDGWVQNTLGHQAASFLQGELTEGDVLAVAGGSTMAAIANMMPMRKQPFSVRVVPARGGLGEEVDLQANTVAAVLAERIGGTSMMLHIPDRVQQHTLEQLLTDPYVRERIPEIRRATIVAHGIGDALRMAERRQLTSDEIAILKQSGAVAEAFGYYFNEDGQPVYAMTTVGLQLADLDRMRLVLAVAGGHSKARAIAAAAKAYRINVLVTDEGAASEILSLASRETAKADIKS